MTSAATASKRTAISITPMSNMTGWRRSMSASAPMTPLRRHRGCHRLRRSAVPGARQRPGYRPQYRRRARPRRRQHLFAQGDTYLLSVVLHRQEDHRRRHLRRPAGLRRPRLLAGGQSTPTSNGCWTPTAPMSSNCRTRRPTPLPANVIQLQQRPGTGGGCHQDRQYRQYRRLARSREFGFETAAEYGRLYGQGGWFHYQIVRRTSAAQSRFLRLVCAS